MADGMADGITLTILGTMDIVPGTTIGIVLIGLTPGAAPIGTGDGTIAPGIALVGDGVVIPGMLTGRFDPLEHGLIVTA